MTFDYRDDGTWTAKKRGGKEVWGKWKFEKRRLCRQETGNSGNWDGLTKKSVCFGIKIDGSRLVVGAQKKPLILDDPAVMARLIGNSVSVSRNAASEQSSALREQAREKKTLEAEKLELERMRIELEKEKQRLEREVLAHRRSETIGATDAGHLGRSIEFGDYHAVVIGINDYENLPDLKTALIDARAVAQTLKEYYGYKIHMLENPTRNDILDKLDELREVLRESDNLLIYYAGHGWLDPQSGRGYWLPANARIDRRSRWFSNSDITDALQALFAKHVMVVADSCYSGTLTRSVKIAGRTPDYIEHMATKRTRVVLSSGGLEPVADSGGGKHSVFAAQFLKALKNNQDILDGTQLFEYIRKNVILNADQTPQYSDIRQAGHEGGDFLFVRKFSNRN